MDTSIMDKSIEDTSIMDTAILNSSYAIHQAASKLWGLFSWTKNSTKHYKVLHDIDFERMNVSSKKKHFFDFLDEFHTSGAASVISGTTV